MNDFQKQTIINLVNIFARKANIDDQSQLNEVINKLYSMNINDAIDTILVSLNDLLDRQLITKEDIFNNIHMIIQLNSEKYTSAKDLIDRLNWIKGMNIEHPSMPLTENHKLVTEAFDNFNKILQDKFDCYYTGGLMGYLATNHELERYHGDLDLFINEGQLVALKEIIDSSSDFAFVSNMDHKEVSGHEYKIVYKETPMSIGLFLFERQPDNSITTKEYYFENQNTQGQLFVDEHHFSKEYTDMSFSNLVRHHNGIPYKMLSLESIYNSKKDGRPKDKYDADIIKDYVNMNIDYKMDAESKNNFDVSHKPLQTSIIHTVEQLMQEDNTKSSTNNYSKDVSNSTENSFKRQLKAFDQRSQKEIMVAQQIKAKNQAIVNQKQQKHTEKPKTLVKTNSKPSSTNKGYIDAVVLALIVSFVSGMFSMLVYLVLK